MLREHIFLVENDDSTTELIKKTLASKGYTVTTANTGRKALSYLESKTPDLLLLDLMLPDLDGFDICRQIKNNHDFQSMPIIIVSARRDEADVVAGLELGAEDYVIKPFSPRVLLARIDTVLRRTRNESEDNTGVIKIKNLMVHPGRREVLVDDRPVYLTSSEFDLLYILAGKPGWVFTRSQIVEFFRGEGAPVSNRSVDVKITGLRKNLGPAARYIETVRGVGYRFKD